MYLTCVFKLVTSLFNLSTNQTSFIGSFKMHEKLLLCLLSSVTFLIGGREFETVLTTI